MGLVELAKRAMRHREPLAPEVLRTARPYRNSEVVTHPQEDGSVVLVAPLQGRVKGLAGWVAARTKTPPERKFELESVGAFVWELCDGEHSFDLISRKLRERYKMNRLEADASLSAFLQMLGQRRLISLLTPENRKSTQ